MATILAATVRQIAASAGVSAMTVSRALRGLPGVKTETRRHVLKAAKELGYTPHPYVASLMSHVRSGDPLRYVETIAYVVPSSADYERMSGYRRYFEGASARAQSQGYKFEIFPFADARMTPKGFSRMLAARGIRGLLVGSFPEESPLRELEWKSFASATVGYSLHAPALHSARSDHFGGMRLAMQQLRARGCKRVGFHTLEVVDQWTSHRWAAAYVHGRYQQDEAILPPLLPANVDRRKFVQWFRRHRPDAVIAKHIEVRRWIEEEDCGRAGASTRFVHLDWFPEYGEVAGVDQQYAAIGTAAVDLVIEQLSRYAIGVPDTPKTVLVAPKWVAGCTA